MKPTILEQLKDPNRQYRPIPFWSWNERLQEAETRRQVQEMDNAGIGGYFMHARGGLQTPYMGSEWMENIAAGIDEARSRGMGAWAYDENGWPSGFGNGLVNGRGLAWQQKYLRYAVVEQESARADGHTISHVRLADGRTLQFYFDVNPFYVDTLDAVVTRVFLEEAYKPYLERFKADMGQAMPGFFTDEPQVSRNGIPWSLTMPEQYRAAFHEELLPLLPELFLPIGSYERTRYRYWWLVQELFVTNFTQQIYDWCEKNGALLTGHMVLEETLHSQLTSNGAVMPHYEFFHMSGMDWLGRHIDPITTPLQVASVAHQLGKRRILSETFALCGWNVTFEELKWIYEWQCVRGITQLCQHLEGYSLRGIRKRDYPPSMFYQEPWWGEYRQFNDVMSRLGMLLAEGDVHYEVLLLHPQQTAWLHYDDATNPGLEELNRAFMETSYALERSHVLFHYGDERIMRRHGSVHGGDLHIGSQAYKVVIVPPLETLETSTIALLQQYAANGGTLLWIGSLPTLVDGMPNAALSDLTRQGILVASPAEAISSLPIDLQRVTIQDQAGVEIAPITYTWRRCENWSQAGPADFYFFTNADVTTEYLATLRLPGRHAARLVLEDGALENIPYQQDGDSLVIDHAFAQRSSLGLMVFTQAPIPALQSASQPTAMPLDVALFMGDWQLELLEPNSLTLDMCAIWLDGQLLSKHEHISVVQNRALAFGRPVQVKLCFNVQVAAGFVPQGNLFLVIEQPETWNISVNGALLVQHDCGYYRDISFRKIDISGLFKPGDNELVLETLFQQSRQVYENLARARVFESEKNKLTFDSEIEAIYLVGSFGVETSGACEELPRNSHRCQPPFTLVPIPQQIPVDDLTRHGLPFFNGKVRLSRKVTLTTADMTNRSFCFQEAMAHVVKLIVNDRPVHTWLWRPFEADLDGFLCAGENLFELELTSGLRNLLGPHHLEQGESYTVHPGLFYKEPNIWGYSPWNDGYCLVKFGVNF
jgi:hypothetical protein